MNTGDGKILVVGDESKIDRMLALKQLEAMKSVEVPYTPGQAVPKQPPIHKPLKVGRNEACPCGKTDEHGKPVKFKRCCLNRQPAYRTVEVFRGDVWVRVRLIDVWKGERFRMWDEAGQPVKDKKGRTEWVASTNGFINGRGVGAIETE
jgi:hypothetical protein